MCNINIKNKKVLIYEIYNEHDFNKNKFHIYIIQII